MEGGEEGERGKKMASMPQWHDLLDQKVYYCFHLVGVLLCSRLLFLIGESRLDAMSSSNQLTFRVFFFLHCSTFIIRFETCIGCLRFNFGFTLFYYLCYLNISVNIGLKKIQHMGRTIAPNFLCKNCFLLGQPLQLCGRQNEGNYPENNLHSSRVENGCQRNGCLNHSSVYQNVCSVYAHYLQILWAKRSLFYHQLFSFFLNTQF